MILRLFSFLLCLVCFSLHATENWQAALAEMPLGTNVSQLNRTNCVGSMLRAFQSNDTVKALIFMPGATDEFYMFHRANAKLNNTSPSLLDAISALTNQTLIRVTFLPPFLLLHSDEDPLEPLLQVVHKKTANKLKHKLFIPHALYNDQDWDSLLPSLTKTLSVEFQPKYHSRDSWHFYRHSFAAWNLNGWEALQAIAMAGKSRITIKRNLVIFEGDTRVRTLPNIDQFPRD
jgi:hypothetical protein